MVWLWLWLWGRLAAAPPIRPLAQELPYATDAALKIKLKNIKQPTGNSGIRLAVKTLIKIVKKI